MERTSKGIWISTEIWQNEDLKVTEKLFIVKINALDCEKGCYASEKQDVQNEIECLELSGIKRKITRTIEENLVDIDDIEDKIEDEIKQLCIDTIEEDFIELDENEVEEEVLEGNAFEEETNAKDIKFNSGNNKSTDNKNKNIKNIDNKNK